MRDPGLTVPADDASHLTWVRTRLALNGEFLASIRHGFSLIATGFGSFSILEGLTLGERQGSELPKAFALAATAVGVVLVLLAILHDRKMTAWVDADEFGAGSAPALPDENRSFYLAAAAITIGLISFVALLLLP